jgi:hypothetical protein
MYRLHTMVGLLLLGQWFTGPATAQDQDVSPEGRPILSADSIFIVAYRSRSGVKYAEFSSYIAARKAALAINTNPDFRANFREVDRRCWGSNAAYRLGVLDTLAGVSRRVVRPPIVPPDSSGSGAGNGIILAGEDSGISPPGPGMRQVDPEIITSRSNYGVVQIDRQWRSLRGGSGLTYDENAPRPSDPGSIDPPVTPDRSQSKARPAAPPTRPVRRPDAPTGFAGLNRRAVRPAPSPTPESLSTRGRP